MTAEAQPGVSSPPPPGPLPTLLLDLGMGWDMPQEQLLAMATALRCSGIHTPYVCCPAGSALALRAAAENLPLRLLAGTSPRHLLSLWRLWRCQQRQWPLLVHAFSPSAVSMAWLLSRLRPKGRTALVYACYSAFWQDAAMQDKHWDKPWLAADKILCANAALRILMAKTTLDPGRMVVVHPGLDVARLPRPSGSVPCHPGRFIFVAAEELCEDSGLYVLLRAMTALWQRADLPPWEVRVIGSGPQLPALLEEAHSLGVASRLALLSRQDWSATMPLCDALVAPSQRAEAIPASIMAAWCMGLPVVCSDIVAHTEVVRAGHTALVVPQGDAQALASAMIRLMTEGALCAQLASKGAEMRAHASLERMAEQTLVHYAQCVARYGWVLPRPRAADALPDSSTDLPQGKARESAPESAPSGMADAASEDADPQNDVQEPSRS